MYDVRKFSLILRDYRKIFAKTRKIKENSYKKRDYEKIILFVVILQIHRCFSVAHYKSRTEGLFAHSENMYVKWPGF